MLYFWILDRNGSLMTSMILGDGKSIALWSINSISIVPHISGDEDTKNIVDIILLRFIEYYSKSIRRKIARIYLVFKHVYISKRYWENEIIVHIPKSQIYEKSIYLLRRRTKIHIIFQGILRLSIFVFYGDSYSNWKSILSYASGEGDIRSDENAVLLELLEYYSRSISRWLW